MPIRTASLSRQIKKTGARLHLVVARRPGDAAAEPSEKEAALREEHRTLKAEQAKRRAGAGQPRPKPVKAAPPAKVAKPKVAKAPKAAKDPKEPKAAKAGANKPSRAEKQLQKADKLEAAKKAERKSAKT